MVQRFVFHLGASLEPVIAPWSLIGCLDCPENNQYLHVWCLLHVWVQLDQSAYVFSACSCWLCLPICCYVDLWKHSLEFALRQGDPQCCSSAGCQEERARFCCHWTCRLLIVSPLIIPTYLGVRRKIRGTGNDARTCSFATWPWTKERVLAVKEFKGFRQRCLVPSFHLTILEEL